MEAVTFDVGGTLIKPWPSVGHVYASVAARFGLRDATPEELNHRFAAAWRTQMDFDYTRAAWRNVVERTFAGLAQDGVGDELFDALYRRFEEASAWRVFDDVPPVLRGLRTRGLRLGVISNWDERLRPLLDRLGLSAEFDVIVSSHEAGCVKPAPAIFARAAALLGCDAARLLHVGDSAAADAEGARRAGCRSLLLTRGPGDAADSGGLGPLTAALGTPP
jgi:putative hydrolase of the HAD superfamily